MPVAEPYAPHDRSWVNVLIDGIERLPGPPWAAYLVGLVGAIVFVSATDWLSGAPVGQILPERAVWGAALVGSAWLIHYLDHVARAALAEFAPLLDASPAAIRDLEHELTVIPALPAVALLALSAFRTAEGFAFQPESEGTAGLTPLALALRFPFEVLLTALVLVLLYHTVRQLRWVGRIHAMAPRVNLFRPAPLYAFSRLTSQTAIGIVPLVIPFSSTLADAVTPLEVVVALVIMALILGTALLAFLVPLLGMHRRMSAEKRRLQTEVGIRIEILIGELHGSVDRRDLSGADGQNKTLVSLIAERELVHRLSTWPWQAGTAGAVGSALLLPIVIWLVTRFLERVT